MSLIWKKSKGQSHISKINQSAWRVVEAQESNSTRKLVDSLKEQAILEGIIEDNKPHVPEHCSNLHYLLYTPFRYPPLLYGSRFGRRTEPSLWYGSLDISTCLAEKAFYQLNFLRGSDAELKNVELPLTVFSASVLTKQGMNLTEAPFAQYTNKISSPTSYEESQKLGANMRESNIEAFLFMSARYKNNGINVGVFNGKAFKNRTPNKHSFQSWHCTANKNTIEFLRSSALEAEVITFSIDDFLVDKSLPMPAI